jgi:hypothetical protein
MSGFDNPQGVRRVLRRIRIKAALKQIAGSTPALLDRLDQTSETDGGLETFARDHAHALRLGDLDRSIGARAIDTVEGKDMREEHLLQGIKTREALKAAIAELQDMTPVYEDVAE